MSLTMEDFQKLLYYPEDKSPFSSLTFLVLFIHFCWLCWQKGQSVIEPFPPRSCMTVVLAYWGNKDSCFSLGNRKPFSCQHDFFHDPYLTKIFNVIKQMLKSTVTFFLQTKIMNRMSCECNSWIIALRTSSCSKHVYIYWNIIITIYLRYYCHFQKSKSFE